MKMSSITYKSVNIEELPVCCGCLSTNRRLYCIQDDKISKAYKCLIGIDVHGNDNLPQYVCNYCSFSILKYMEFRKACWHSKEFLEKSKLNHENILSNLFENNHLQYSQTETKILSIDNDIVTYDTLSYTPDDYTIDTYDHSDDFKYDVPTEELCEDLKIFTENITIESRHNSVKNTRKLHNSEVKKKSKQKNIIKASNVIEKAKDVCNKKDKKYGTKKKCKKNQIMNEQKGKYFETKDNIEQFEKQYGVDIIILDKAQQMNDVLDRKLTINYLHSPYKCELCFKGFIDEDILNKHVLSQHDPSRGDVICEFCKFRYRDKRALTQHLKSHRLKFACKQCKFVSRTTFNAKEHHKMHGGQLHECKHCGKSYEKLSSYLSHMRIHHPSEFVWCDLCGEAFIGQFGLNSHKKKAHRDISLPSQCNKCNKCFISPNALQTHEQQSSNGGATCRNSCAHCGHNFHESMKLRDHLLTVHKSTKIYACEKCDKTFGGESQYSAHYRRMHVNSEEIQFKKRARPWVCEICGKTLPSKSLLLYHQRTHTGERPYQCPHCDKDFTVKRLLQSHLSVHSSERPHACKLCPKTFKGRSALRSHEQVHSEGKNKTTKNRRD